MKHTTELLIIICCAALGGIALLDWLIYAMKSAPKQSTLPNLMWKIGFICAIVLLYWYFNGQTFA